MLAAGAAQRFQHVADSRTLDLRELDHLDALGGRHDVDHGQLVAPHAPPGGGEHRALAEEVVRGENAEHALVLVDHQQQPHAARDHELIGAGERCLRADRRRRGAREIGHHRERRRLEGHAF